MVCRDAVQEIDIHLFLVGCLHTFDDAEIVHGGLERGDVTDIAGLELGLVGFTVPLREKRRLEDTSNSSPVTFSPDEPVS